MQGTVKWFNETKGYGFITPTGGGDDVFVHITAVQRDGGQRTLREGEPVEYEVSDGERGPKAQAVRPMGD